jgi:LPXTG-site transpeptidase (sortase) family protein
MGVPMDDEKTTEPADEPIAGPAEPHRDGPRDSEPPRQLDRLKMGFKAHAGWYAYPAIFFIVTSLVLYQRMSGQASLTGALGPVWRNLALVPAVVWVGAVTLWIIVSALMGPKATDKEGEAAGKRHPVVRVVGVVLIVAGAAVLIWLARPYITLVMSSGRMAELEQKAEAGQVPGDWIIIPGVLVDAPIREGFTEQNLAAGIAHLSDTAKPGEGGNVVLEGHNLAEVGLIKANNLFSLLELAGPGTRVYVFYGGKKYVYEVDRKTYKDVTDPDIYGEEAGERLTMVTCVSTWSPTIYTQRRAVVTALPAEASR